MGSGLLSREVTKADFVGGSTVDPMEFSHIREERIARLAGMTVGDMVRLNMAQFKAIDILDEVLPTRIRGEEVRVVRAALSFVSPLVLAPRGGQRLYELREKVDPVAEAKELTDGMDTKYIINFQSLIAEGLIDPIRAIPVGAKSEIVTPIDPREYTDKEREIILRETVDVMNDAGLLTDSNHHFGPDVNMRPQDMATMRDRYIELGADQMSANAIFTGTPIGDGGIAGRHEATALGGAVVFDEYLRRLQVDPGTIVRFSIQGFGNAGAPFVDRFIEVSEYKGLLVSVSDQTGTFICPSGISTPIFRNFILQTDQNGEKKYMGVAYAASLYKDNLPMTDDAVFISAQENPHAWLEVEADCYVPAAMARGINGDNIQTLIKRVQRNKRQQVFFCPLANHGVDPKAQYLAEYAGMRTLDHAHANGYGVVGSIASTLLAYRDFPTEARHDPSYLEKLIQKIARTVTRQIFHESRERIDDVPSGVSMPMAVEVRRYRKLARRYGN